MILFNNKKHRFRKIHKSKINKIKKIYMKTKIQDNKMNRRQKKLNKKQKINCKHKMNKNKKRKLK